MTSMVAERFRYIKFYFFKIMEISIKEKQEQLYLAIVALAVKLSLECRTMTCDQVLIWIKENFTFPFPYVSVRGVFQAVWRRANDDEKEAVASVFTNKYGVPLVR